MKLKEARKQIDNIDAKIEELLDERMLIVKDIAAQKAITGGAICDPKREEEKLAQLTHKEVFQAIMDESKDYQKDHLPSYGLLGRKLEHSASPELHKLIAGYDYALFEVEPEDLDDFFKNCKFKGINITIPYKEIALKHCDDLSDEAKASRCVNLIKREVDGKLMGYNTDNYGFLKLIEDVEIDNPEKVIILGRGGAAKAARTALIKHGVDDEKISFFGRGEIEGLYAEGALVVNATPAGMYPNNEEMLIDPKGSEAVIDVIYNPIKTRLILEAEKNGIPTVGGLKMLFYQAVRSAEIFLDEKFSEKEMAIKYAEFEKAYQNIALIGMPGCGKSTVGKKLAELTGRKFVDLDNEIYSREGQTAEEIILLRGEKTFRRIESEVLAEVSKEHGLVIATGGGVVTTDSNCDLLKANSKIIYIKRNLDELSVEERPISKQKGIEKLFEERAPIYEAWADLIIEADDSEMAAGVLAQL